MGRMKDFGLELAEKIYWEKKTDAQLIAIYSNVDKEWLLKQIKTIRDNPDQWRP